MKRRQFIAVLGGAAAWPLVARAQVNRVGRVGVLMGLAEDDPEGRERYAAFRRSLQNLGWSEGRNIRFVARWAGGDVGRTRDYAAELVGLRPEVILVNTPTGLAALQQATRTIPIVFVQVVDAAEGAINSPAHPGGNATGFYTFFEYSMAGKWLQLLKEVSPRVKRVAAMMNPDHPAWTKYLSAISTVALPLGIELIPAGVQAADEIDQIIQTFAERPDGGLIVLPDTFTTVHRDSIVSATARNRLPSIGPVKSFAAAGGLISYGADLTDLMSQSASYIDRILRSEKPGDLPVQASTKFELVINRKTAKALGIEFPSGVLALADEVIE